MALGQEIASAYVRIGADTAGLTQGLSKAKNELRQFGAHMPGFEDTKARLDALGQSTNELAAETKRSSAAIALGYATIALAIGGFVAKSAIELSKLGAEHDRLATSMGHLADQYNGDADLILSALRRTSSGTISDTDLILSANRAMMLGLGANADQLGQLMEVARVSGRAMGMSTAESYNDLIASIGKMSAASLANQGIIIDAKQAYEDYAASIGKSADALTDAEKKQVLLRAAISEGQKQIAAMGGTVQVDAIDKFDQLSVKWENLRTQLGQSIKASVIVDVVMNALDAATEGRGARTGKMGQTAEDLARLQSDLENYQKQQSKFKEGSVAWNLLQDDIDQTKQEIARLTAELDLAADAAYRLMGALGSAFGARAAYTNVDQRPEWLRIYTAAGGSTTGTFGTNTWDAAQDKAMKTLMRGAEVEKFKTDQLERDTLAQRANADAMRERQQAYDSLISTIKGLMTATSVTELDMLQTKYGGYTEKWDEYARRLQDVINLGEQSPWAQKYLPGMGGEQLKMGAMEKLEAFRAGDYSQMPEDDYKAMIQSLADKYNQYTDAQGWQDKVAADVAALVGGGIGDVKGFMGTAKPEEAGATFNAGVIQGATDSGIAEPLAKAWRDDISKNAETLKDVGKAAYEEVFKGIQKAIEEGTSFVQLLAEATAPVVAGIIAREKNRGGATP